MSSTDSSSSSQQPSRSVTVIKISSGADPSKAKSALVTTPRLLVQSGQSSDAAKKTMTSSSVAQQDNHIQATTSLEKEPSSVKEGGLDSDKPDASNGSFFYELTKRMTRLYCADVLDAGRNPEVLADFKFIQRCLEEHRDKSALPSRIVELGFVELCQHICRSTFFRKEFFGDRSALETVSAVLGVTADITDRTPIACRRVLHIDFHKDLFAMLLADSLDPTKVKKFGEWHCFVADCILAVIYNVVQAVTEARELYRDENAVKVFQRFRTNTSDSVSSQSLILQSYVINEDENDFLGSDDRSFAFLAEELNSALANSEGEISRSNNGYRAIEILTAVNKLAVNDSNKPKIVGSGALDGYAKLLAPDRSVDEQYLAAQGLWTLAMNCAEQVRAHQGCVQGLKSLLKASDVDGVRRQVCGAIDALGVTLDGGAFPRPARLIQIPSATATAGGEEPSSSSGPAAAGQTQMLVCSVGAQGSSTSQPIFISYNHASKSTVLRLRDRLKATGFTVWVDDEGVYESIADDIITGLEQSSVVLVCMTQRYYESPYCKKEVVYAAESYKKIIPLTLEPRYNPHGWLRFHTSDGLRYDFSDDQTFEDSFRRLAIALRKVFDASANKSSAGTVPQTPSATTTSSATTAEPPVAAGGHQEFLSHSSAAAVTDSGGLRSWTSAEVTNWLANNDLQHLSEWFKGFDGELLLEYKAYRQYSPETLAACVQDERQRGAMTILDVMKLNRAFKRL